MITKGKIIQMWDSNHENVIKYTQEITNDKNKTVIVEAETLNSLMSKVKTIISEIN